MNHAPDPHRKALLSKAASLILRLNASVAALRVREQRAATVERQLYLAVSEALLAVLTPREAEERR